MALAMPLPPPAAPRPALQRLEANLWGPVLLTLRGQVPNYEVSTQNPIITTPTMETTFSCFGALDPRGG